MAYPGWKQFENRVAKLFGSRRTPLSGSNSAHTCSDSLHEDFFIECKLRQSFAHHALYSETAKLAEKEGKIPVVVTQKARSPSYLIVIDKDYLLTFCRKYLESKGFRIVRSKR